MALFESLGKYKNTGLLLLRVGIGTSLMIFGYPKLAGGPELWKGIGGTMEIIGIDFLPVIWGFLAAASEGIGGFLILIGLFFRPTAVVILCTMAIAAAMQFDKGQGIKALHTQ